MNRIKKFTKNNPQLTLLILLIIIFSILMPAFRGKNNIINILKQSTTISIISYGVALVVIGGNLDLSVGALLSLTLGLSISMSMHNVALAILVPLGFAIVVGFVNGYIVGRFRVNSIILTLGMMSVINGIVQTYRKGNIVIGMFGGAYQAITDAKVFGIPSYIVVYISIAILYQFILTRTVYGRQLILMGTNRDAAEIAGINIRKVTIISFVICGVSVAVASILMGARLLQGSTNTGAGLEFDALTAILIGGVSIEGGKGNILNAMIGVFLLAVIINGLTLLNVPFAWRNVAKGLMILLAILTEQFLRTRNA